MSEIFDRRVAEAQVTLALAVLVEPSCLPDVNRAIILLDNARDTIPGLSPIIEMLFTKPVPRISEAIAAIRALLPHNTGTAAVNNALERVNSATTAVQAECRPLMIWAQLLESGPTENIRAHAARKMHGILLAQQANADALKHNAADAVACLTVVYNERMEQAREAELGSSSSS